MATDAHDELVRRSFEQQLPVFSAPDSPFAGRGSSSLAWIEPLDRGMVVLDVACGAAHAAEEIAPAVRQVVGIDLTRPLLDLGAERLTAKGLANVLLQEGKAEALPFVGRSFDLVFCRSALHHFGDPERAVSEMARVCRLGGRVVLNDLVAPEAAVRQRFDHLHRLLDPSHARSFLEAELMALAGEIGSLGRSESHTLRLPIDVAVTEQSDRQEVWQILSEELEGAGPPTGLEPALEDGRFVVSFRTATVQVSPGV